MEKELTELFELVKKAADASKGSSGEEDRCLDALKQLKKFPVNYQVLVSTQVGKNLRQLTKHSSDKIRSLATEVVNIWKDIIVKETKKSKKTGTTSDAEPVKSEPTSTVTNETIITKQRTNSIKSDHNPTPKKNPEKSIKIEKPQTIQMKPKPEKQSSSSMDPPKLTSLVLCKDPTRDKIREILSEALCKVSDEVSKDVSGLKEQVSQCDPYRVAVMVETAMFEKWGRSTGPQKFKYRSVVFNIKDPNNKDFRRKVLVGEIEARAVLELTPEEMASDERQEENAKIKQKAMFNSERAAAPKASTNEFTCGRCKKKETTYYQMQTRSADEPMTTFVTCVNCNNHWKFC